MDFTTAITELEALGTEQTKKTYKNHGALEPLFGVTLRDMKPLTKKIKKRPCPCHGALRYRQL